MRTGQLILAALLASLAGLFLVDISREHVDLLPTVVYAVPIVLAGWCLQPRYAAVIAVVSIPLQISAGLMHRVPTERIVFDTCALAVLGFLAVALSARISSEAELKRRAQERLDEFRFLTENTRDIIFRLDLFPSRRYTYVNPAIREILGYTPEELYADPDLTERFVHPEDLPALQELAANPLPERTVVFRAAHRDGHLLWLEQRNQAIYDQAGRIVGYEGVARDITERKLAEAEVLRSNAELEAVVRALPDIFLRIDRQDRVVDCKVGRGTPLFATVESMLGKRVEEILPPDAATRIEAAIGQVRQTNELATVEYALPFPEGDRTYESRFLPFIDHQLIVVVRDVSDRERLLAELRVAREAAERDVARLDATFQSMTDAVIIYDLGGNIVTSNAAADNLFAYSPEQKLLPLDLRLSLLDIHDENGQPFPIEHAPPHRALRGEIVTGITMVVRPPNRKTVWLSASGAPISDAEGHLVGAVATFTDVTTLHELQEGLRDLVRSLSHDLRNPLTAVLGQSQLLAMILDKRGLEENTVASARSILAAARRMNEMIVQLTEATRIESGQLPVNQQRLDLAEFLSAFLGDPTHSLDTGRIAQDIPSGLPEVLADLSHLGRILTNLLSNAQKYSFPGTEIVVRAARADGFIEVSVVDRGPGIAPEDLPKLFDRFFRAKRTAKAEGLGMGLFITRALVEAQGGELSVESKVGEGSTFTFTLPTAG